MRTYLFTHSACLEHQTKPGHPESPERLEAVLRKLDGPEFASLARREAPRADRDQLSRVHDLPYIERVFATVPASGEANIAPDTIVSPGSGEASLRAAGAACAAVDAVASGAAGNAFCAVRPPGHHAANGNTMGFCVFNNAAVGAAHARLEHGYDKVAVVDFDVHHGNGTQMIFRQDPSVYFGSIHQSFTFPRSGARCETGVGNIVNVPVARGISAAEFRRAFEVELLPSLRRFAPDFLILSAGFDAHVRDPLGDQRLGTRDFAWITDELLGVAAECCDGRVVSVLEGGYDPKVLAATCAVHVRRLMTAAAGTTAGSAAA